MPRSIYLVAALAACMGCTQSQPTELSTAPSAATALAVAETEAAPAPADVEPSTESPVAKQANVEAKPAVEPTRGTTKARTAAKPVVAAYSSNVPAVLMSAEECAGCAVTVGDQMPAMKLPKLDGGDMDLASLAGKQATVVLFWGADRWMSQAALADLQRDVTGSPSGDGVAVVGVAVGMKADAAAAEVEKSGVRFAQLLDADGAALAQLGGPGLPRLYVLDAAGKIAWFDIEYSEASRRELHDTLGALTNVKP